MLISLVDALGATVITLCADVGNFTLFGFQALRVLVTTRLGIASTIEQMEHIGVNSFNIIFLTGSFTGMVLALQSYIGFHRFGAEEFIGPIVALSMTRELGPVLSGLMVTGRAGSAIAAELGTMRISEQIDALRTLGINSLQYLVVPRLLASTLTLPCLSLVSMLCGILGGYLISIYVLHLNPEQYMNGIRTFLELSDIVGGLYKSAVFGFILAWVGTYKGYFTTGGAKGVGIATTQSVVISSILILIANYFLTAALF